MSTLILSIFVIIAIAISPVVVAFSIYIWIPRLIRNIRNKPDERWRPKPVQMKLKMENPPPPPPAKKKSTPQTTPNSGGTKPKKADEPYKSYATGTDDIMTSGILFGTGILSDNSPTDTGTTSNWDSGGSSYSGGSSDSFGGGDFGGGGSGGDWGSSSND